MKVDRIVGMKNSSLREVLSRRNAVYEKRYTLRVSVAPNDSPEAISEKVMTVLSTQGTCFVSTRSSAKETSFARVLVMVFVLFVCLFVCNFICFAKGSCC
jgi:hypothetical protein